MTSILSTYRLDTTGSSIVLDKLHGNNIRSKLATVIQSKNQTFGITEHSDHRLTSEGQQTVILLTYMRSGSSFTGQILQAAPSAFYWFEPMHQLLNRFTTRKPIQFLNGDKRDFLSKENVTSLTTTSILSCKLSELPLDVLTDGFLNKGNEKTSHQLMSCLASFRRISSEPGMALRRCLPDYEMVCNNSKHVVIKTIRMSMSSMERLLVNFPRLKVIHLMRDPRGTVGSQKRYGELRKCCNETESVRMFCSTVLRDVIDREDLQRRFPNRIMSVFYEDIAEHPIRSSKELYSFLGMNYTSESEKEILHMTSSGSSQKNCGMLCIFRPNSSKEAYEWRHEISINFVKMVDKVCVDLYKKLGYNTIPNKKILHDLQYSLRNNN
ncbi:carbohydrate sulfotransferase 1-like [Argopecten irradians]|uniref:carbohydrate sulfotransferase 1-like n=1 Tax=Argopecten irradians TaxID=31199 RepID=UPI0037126A3F